MPDLISGVSNHIVRPVANGTLVYRYQYAEVGQDTVYRFWIDHPADGDTTYAGLATRYLHIGGYPGKELHGPGIPRTVTTKDTLGTIITPDDGFDDHVHFEVRDGNNRRDADYINPLRKLPAITDATVNYATGRNPWTWTVESETRTEEYDVSASEAESVSLPKTDLMFLFEGFDRINRPANRLGFYSMRANFIKSRTADGEALTDTLLKYIFTADRLPHGLWLRPEYLFDTHRSSASEFHYRLFAHENANNLSITMTDGQGAAANPDSVDDDGYIDGAAYDLSSGHSIQVVVGDYAGDTLSKKLVLSATAIGDRFSDLRAKGNHRQVTLSWYSFRAGGWTEFEIQRSRDSGVSYTAIGTLAYDPASEDGEYEYVDGTATDAVTYYYRIFTDELYGPVWASSSGADPAPVPTGTPAISLGNTGAGYYGLQIDTGSDYANGYQVVYGPVDQAFPWSANLSGTNETTVYDELLGTGAYKVRVRAYNSAGDGPYSNEVRFTLAPPSKPATPTVTVEAVRAGSDRGWVLMRWTANSEPDIVGYRIYCFDGTEYQHVDDVGGISWSSLGANIWPTDAEVADGRYGLHGDDSGTDLKNDPHQVYTNSPSATYNDSIAFWFAVKAKNRLGNLSALSDPLRVILPGASGSLAVDESWAGHVRVSGDVTVPAGLTLTIAPGSVVQFSAGDDRSAGESTTRSEILVHGTLDAEGATFTTADAGSKWGGLVLSGDRSSDTRTLLTGNTIEHAATGVRLKTSGWTLGGAAAEDGNVIRDCDIGIVLESSEAASRNVVRHNTVADCARGVFVKQGVADTVRQNLITGSQAYGLQVWGRDTQVVNNTLHSTERVGVRFGGRSSGTVRSTIASGFPAGGVVNEGTGAVTVDYYLGHDTGTDDLKGTTAGTRRALLFSDPAFTDTAAGDFTLQSGSPALDLGAPGATGLAASDGDRIDLGRYGGTAQAGEAPGRLEIEDYFYNGQISGDWTAAEGTWSGDATQGTYEAAAQTTGSSRAHQTLDAAHYRLETRLQGAEGQVLYARADGSDSFRVHLSASQDSVRLFTRNASGAERILSQAFPLEDDEWYAVRVAVADEQVSVSLNDSLLHDQVSTHVPADGAVGVGSYGDGSPAVSVDYFLAMHVSGPGRPQGLTATPGDRQVDLRWTAAADHGTAITGYQHRHRAAGGTWSTWAATSTTTSQTVTGLRSDTRYALQVRPVSGGVSGVSAQTTAQTPVAQLTVSFGAATYQATEAGAVVSVRVGVSPATDRPVDLPITVTAASGTESGDYTVTGLSQQSTLSFVKGSTSASFAVTALEDADGDDEQVSLGFGSPLPNRVSAGTPSSATVTLEDSLAVPDAPGNLAAAAGDRQVRLSWETPDSNGARITGYSLQDSIDGGRWSTWSAIEGSDRATTSHTVRSLLNDTLYTFRVLATNRMGDGPASNRASATPKAPVITPPQPCTVSLAGSGSVSFAENRTDSVDTYTATASNCGTLTWSRTGPDSSVFRLSGSGSSRDLHFKSTPNYEQPSDAGGNNVYEVGVVAAAGSPPVADTLDVTVTVTNEPDPGAVTLSPSTPRTCAHVEGRLEDEDGGINTVFSDSPPGFPYGWRWIPQTSSSSRSPAATTSTTQSYFVGNSLVGQTVRATVQYGDNASDRNTASRTSGEVAANTPRTPTGLSATPGDRQVSLSWTAPNDCGSTITGYRYWYRKTSETAWEDSGTAAGTDTSVTGLDNNQAYRFEVRAANAIGRGGAATTDATTDPPPPCTLSLSGPAAVDYAENGSDAVGQYTATYSNCGSLSWSRAGADSSAFGLSQFSVLPSASGSSQRWLHFNNSPNYEAKSAYSVTVKITSGSTSASQAVSVTIQDVNEGPVISGPASPSVAENTTPVATYSATDPENDSITWSRAGTGSSHFTISSSGALAFTSAKDYESDQTTYSVTVKASDGQLTRNKPVTVTVTNEPDSGSVTLSPSTPQTCAHLEGRLEDEDGGINTVFSDSPPGFPYGWQWIPQISSSSHSPAATTSTTQSYFVGNALVGQTIRATVQYGDEASLRNTASQTSGTVAANAPRTPTGLEATPGDRRVSLSWSAPNDCGSTITGYPYWYRKTSETAWEDSGTAAGTDTSVTGLDDNQAYRFEVRAANAIGRGGAATTDATTDPPPPCTLSLSGPAAVDYAENGSDAVGQYTATYSNCGSLSWSRAGADSSAFGLSQFSVLPSASGSSQRWLHFNNSPNYEAKSAYSVTVKITSGSTSASQAVSVTIQDVNEGPVISGPASPSVAENTTPVATYSATDPENDSITWSRAGTGSSHFTISSSGALAFTSAKDYESDQTTYSVTVKASDGQLTRNKPVTVTVTDVNEPPVISGSDNVSVPENTTPVATYTATDPESDAVEWSESSTTFTIGESSGALAFASAPNYESDTTSYNVTVTATDNGEPSASSGTSVTVTVTNADDLGSVSLSTGSPYVGDQVTATLTDEDGGITGPTWSWSSVGTGVGAASVESYRYTVAVSDFGKHLKASVGYDDAHGSDKSASSSSAEPVKAHPPDPPPDLEAARGDSQVVLTWGAADGNGAPILDYSYRHRSDTGSWPGYTSISERTKTIGNLTNGTLYHFEVRARNIGAAGSASSASATPAGLPGLPQGVGTARVGTSITVDWSAAPANGSAIERYEVDELEGITWLGWTSVGTSTTYTKESVSHSQAYTFRVRAKNGVGYGSSVEVTSPPLGPGGNSAKLAVPGLAAAPDSVLAAVSAPNPFNPSTTLHFQLPEAGPVWLTIHNTTGQIVTTLVRGTDLEAGIHSRLWDGHDDRGRPAASGLYLFRLIAGPEIRVGKLALIR